MTTTLTIPDLPDPVRRALSARALRNGRSLDAEAREILEQATKGEEAKAQARTAEPTPPAKADMDLAALLYAMGREAQLTDEEVDLYFNSVRDKTPMRIPDFDDPA